MELLDQLKAKLEKEYCPPLDPATFLAILQDYDITNPTQLSNARQIFDLIKQDAETEEASGFDATGSSGNGLATFADTTTESGSGKTLEWSSTTDDTSLSQAMSLLDLEGTNNDGDETVADLQTFPDVEYEGLDQPEKESILSRIFPSLRPFDIQWSLKKVKGDMNRAIDELMTQSFLIETGARKQSVDAFSESRGPSVRRKAKSRRNRRQTVEDLTQFSASESKLLSVSKWDAGQRDVEILCLRTGITEKQASSIYHKNGGSIRSSLLSIIKAHQEINLEMDENTSVLLEIQAFELREEFPTISQTLAEGLVQITHPSFENAQELAKVLITSETSNKVNIQVELRHAPLKFDWDEASAKPLSLNAVYPDGLPGPSLPSQDPTTYREGRDAAYKQAAAAYRKSKSQALMGGAAAYYAEVGRDLDAKARRADSFTADTIAASQSTYNSIDLHGISVKDAMRISRERVTSWWHSQNNQRDFSTTGYKIITGMGHHSDGGKGKIGPAVGNMLVREGWKVEIGNPNPGAILVTGVAKKSATGKKR